MMTPAGPRCGVSSDELRAWLDPLTEAALEAGRAILAVRREAIGAREKSDGSPVTDADHAADAVIDAALRRLAPDIPVLSEERAAAARIDPAKPFFIVDPLDGTREFVAGRDEYTVNIAMIMDGAPAIGVIGAPALGLAWRGLVGQGAERLRIEGGAIAARTPIHARPMPREPQDVVAAVSRSHADSRTEAYLTDRQVSRRVTLGSALKFCRLAEGELDLYPRLSPTSEWDVAAGCALVVAAGGSVMRASGAPLRFGQSHEGYIVPDFIASGAAAEG